jgi:hypothetical protein
MDTVRQGTARRGSARRGSARRGLAGMAGGSRFGTVDRCMRWRGLAGGGALGCGKAGQDSEWIGTARQARFKETILGLDRSGTAW